MGFCAGVVVELVELSTAVITLLDDALAKCPMCGTAVSVSVLSRVFLLDRILCAGSTNSRVALAGTGHVGQALRARPARPAPRGRAAPTAPAPRGRGGRTARALAPRRTRTMTLATMMRTCAAAPPQPHAPEPSQCGVWQCPVRPARRQKPQMRRSLVSGSASLARPAPRTAGALRPAGRRWYSNRMNMRMNSNTEYTVAILLLVARCSLGQKPMQ